MADNDLNMQQAPNIGDGTGDPASVPPITGQDPLAAVSDDGVTPDPVKMEELIEKAVNERLAPIKESLNSAYSERDEAKREAAAIKQQAHEAQLAALKEEGKESEALKLQLSDLQGKYDALLSKQTELSRDNTISDAIAGLEFKNDTARKLALAEISKDLVQDEAGNWVHKSGISVQEYADFMKSSDEYAFLIKQPTSSGPSEPVAGQQPRAPGVVKHDPNAPYMTKPIMELTSEEAIMAAQAGRFGEPESPMAPF